MPSPRALAFLCVTTLTIGGCTPQPPPSLDKIVPEARGEKPIQGLLLTCTNEYDLTQDCSALSDPITKRRIEIAGTPVSIAGSSDGRVVVVGIGYTRRELKKRSLTYSPAAAQAFELVRQELARVGIRVLRARAIVSGPVIVEYAVGGYALELDGDGYSHLKPNVTP